MSSKATGTLRLLRELRSLRVLMFHPEDQDGQELIAQLQRIGCQVKAFWPPMDRLPEEADLIFFAVRPEMLSMDVPWLWRDDTRDASGAVTRTMITLINDSAITTLSPFTPDDSRLRPLVESIDVRLN